jgi:DNA polymerase III sliding clamp (beta) subunit (PCNA family)
MKVDRKELQTILESLRPGLAQKEQASQTCHFIFTGEEIVTFNQKICITHPFESDAIFSIKGEEFYRLVSGITEEELEITVSKNKIKVVTDSTSSTMTTLADEKNTLPETLESLKNSRKNWKALPKDFLRAISLCSFSVSPDLTQAVNNCVAIMEGRCWAMDHARASVYEMSEEIPQTLNIPGKTAEELVKFPVIEYCIGDNWVHFRTKDDVIFSYKELAGKLAVEQVMRFIPELLKLPTIKLPAELKSAVDTTIVLATDLADKTGKFLEITIETGKILMKASNDLGEVIKNVKCDYEGEPIRLNINSRFFSQILERSTELATGDQSVRHLILFTSGDFSHVLSQTSVVKAKKEEGK